MTRMEKTSKVVSDVFQRITGGHGEASLPKVAAALVRKASFRSCDGSNEDARKYCAEGLRIYRELAQKDLPTTVIRLRIR
jgi:hypothetical protein